MKRILRLLIRIFKSPSPKATDDFFLIISLTLLAYVFGIHFEDIKLFADFFEKIGFLHPHQNHYHLNATFFPPLCIFTLGLCWYSWRRWREAKKGEFELEKIIEERTSELHRFKGLIDQINDTIIIANPHTAEIIEFNDQACKSLGYTKNELLNLKITDIEATIPTMRLWDKHVKEVKEKKTIVIEGVRKRRNGTTFIAEITVNYVIHKNEKYMVGIIHDISDRIEAEEALRKSEERFRSLAESSPDLIWAIDKKFTYTYVSPKIKDILGYSQEEVIGKSPFDLMPRKEVKKILKKSKIYHSKKIPFENCENINIHKNGKLVILETSGTPILDSKRDVIGWQGIARDITNRKKLEEEFSVQNAQMQKLFEDSPEAIVLWDNDDRVLQVNDKFVELFGFSRQELIGKLTNPLIVPKNLLDEGINLTKEIQKGKTVELETIRKRKGGEEINVSIIAHPLKVIDNKIIVYGIYRDITERKILEKDISVQKAYMEKLFQESPEAIALLDNKAKVIKINKNFINLFGYSEKEALGKNIDYLIIPKKLEEDARSATKKITSGETIDFESIRKNKNGQEIAVSILGHPILLNDDQLAIYVIYRDITERKEAQDRLLESYKHLGIINRQLEMLSFLRNYKGKSKQQALQYILTCAKNFSREKYVLYYEYQDKYSFSFLKSIGCGEVEKRLKKLSVESWESLKKLVDKKESVFTSNDLQGLKKLNNDKIKAFLAVPIQKNNKLKGMIVFVSDKITQMSDHVEFYNVFAAHSSRILSEHFK
ncbi:PAS domain S-box protein [Candidatus Gracilibacteria bacterium]|nr:PAS domain S-box protein [Candidatus Gracilibacteria bacterium]